MRTQKSTDSTNSGKYYTVTSALGAGDITSAHLEHWAKRHGTTPEAIKQSESINVLCFLAALVVGIVIAATFYFFGLRWWWILSGSIAPLILLVSAIVARCLPRSMSHSFLFIDDIQVLQVMTSLKDSSLAEMLDAANEQLKKMAFDIKARDLYQSTLQGHGVPIRDITKPTTHNRMFDWLYNQCCLFTEMRPTQEFMNEALRKAKEQLAKESGG